jgi:Cu(I)/Ag(I) efflux system membrane fusion protein
MLSPEQIRLANIRVDTVGRGGQSRQTVLTGTLAVNPNGTQTVSSRVQGRVEKLYVQQTGEAIRKGAPLFDVYSENLQTLQNEYLLALAQKRELGDPEGRYSRLVEAAAQRLELLGLTPAQLKRLAGAGKPSPTVTFFSPVSGVVQEIAVTEGQYVGEGNTLLTLADLSTLWVEAQLYAGEASGVVQGAPVTVQVAGTAERLPGKVSFLNPAVEAGSKIVLARIEIPNPGGRLLPGMQANVSLKENRAQIISLPLEAVLRDSKGAYVWKQTGEGTFAVAMVRTGAEDARTVEITEGIAEGDRVVTSGAYLLHSEYTLRKGADPMAGHDHGKIEM